MRRTAHQTGSEITAWEGFRESRRGSTSAIQNVNDLIGEHRRWRLHDRFAAHLSENSDIQRPSHRSRSCFPGPREVSMLAAILATQITVAISAPPVSPDQAVRILRGSRSIADRTDVRSLEIPEGPSVVVVRWEPGDGPFGAFPRFRPLRPINPTRVFRLPQQVNRPLSFGSTLPSGLPERER